MDFCECVFYALVVLKDVFLFKVAKDILFFTAVLGKLINN